MVTRMVCQEQDGGDMFGLDPLRAAVIMFSVCQMYNLNLKEPEYYHLCATLCLPKIKKEDFANYWVSFVQEVSFLRVYVFTSLFFFFNRNTRMHYYRLYLVSF